MKRKSDSKTCNCGGHMVRRKVSRTIPLAGRRVRVEDVPASVCDECGEIYLDGPTLLRLEKKLLKQPVTA
ncbi:MAG TPA: YgiT-type zinc finger protein [Pyrinomonadaceae bacterium]